MRSLESLGRRATIQPSVDRNGIITRCKGLAGIVVRDGLRWTPIFGRLDKVELRGWEAPYQEQDDGREAAGIWGGIQG